MKQTLGCLILSGLIALAPFVHAQQSGGGHSGHAMGHPMPGQPGGHGHGAVMGDPIHESTVDGYVLAYHLMDLREKLKAVKGMENAKITHHLMVYPRSPDGRAVEDAKVAYTVEAPDGTRQHVAAMFMKGGYGGDVFWKTPGKYTVVTRMETGGKTLSDRFVHEVK